MLDVTAYTPPEEADEHYLSPLQRTALRRGAEEWMVYVASGGRNRPHLLLSDTPSASMTRWIEQVMGEEYPSTFRQNRPVVTLNELLMRRLGWLDDDEDYTTASYNQMRRELPTNAIHTARNSISRGVRRLIERGFSFKMPGALLISEVGLVRVGEMYPDQLDRLSEAMELAARGGFVDPEELRGALRLPPR